MALTESMTSIGMIACHVFCPNFGKGVTFQPRNGNAQEPGVKPSCLVVKQCAIQERWTTSQPGGHIIARRREGGSISVICMDTT